MITLAIVFLFSSAVAEPLPPPHFVDCYDASQNTTVVINDVRKDYACMTNPHCDCGLCTKVSNLNTSRQADEYCVILSTNNTELFEKGFICPTLDEEMVEQCSWRNHIFAIYLMTVAVAVILLGCIFLCICSHRLCCERRQKSAQYEQL